MLDQITDFISDLPISLIIFAIAMLFGLFGRGDNDQRQAQPRPREQAPPPEPSTYASDDRRFEGDLFDEPGSAFEFGADDEMFRGRPQWGQTKFGFDEHEWGSTFDKGEDQWGDKEKPDSEPRIEIG